MIYSLPYGQSRVEFRLPYEVDWISPPQQSHVGDPEELVVNALKSPVSGNLDDFRGVEHVAIAINDKTRPVPHHLLIPPLLSHLQECGFTLSRITLFVATGTHIPVSEPEFSSFLPKEVLDRVKVVSHDVDEIDNFSHLGFTSRGTPVVINKRFLESGLRIVVGDIELHHFAGFSGGVKSAVIGLGSRESIQRNHKMLTDPNASIGIYEENPLRQDIEEAGRIIGIHFALNAVLTEHKQIVAAYFGRPDDVMKAGIPTAVKLSAVAQNKKFDIVIASAGGYPKDINFYQAQKAISHACLFSKTGGTIILVAECREGSGSSGYEVFMRGIKSVKEITRKFNEMGFVVGPHKALQLARQLEHHKILLYSALDPELVSGWLITPVVHLEKTLQECLSVGSSKPDVAVLPYATGVFPVSD